ncbi:hypothetical protein FRC01_007350 [Tulasnella sp. 417]|nr:hypothetical protein FRC01_007350 [Tulasnella sp. 417]
MSREAIPFGQTFRRAYIYGTNDPQPQTGSPGNQPVLNTITTEENKDYGLFPGKVSITGQPLPTNSPPLVGGVGEVGAYRGYTPGWQPPLPPDPRWRANLPTQYIRPNTYPTHQSSPNDHGTLLPAPALVPANILYLPQSPLGAPYGHNNPYYPPSFPNALHPTEHPQGGPPLSQEAFNEFLETGLVPMQPTTPLPSNYAFPGVQNLVANNETAANPVHGQPGWHPVASEFSSTQGPQNELGLPSATIGRPEGGGTTNSMRVQSPSQSSHRNEEIQQAWIDLERYCRCKDRTKKPLRHWEDQCRFNVNKRPLLYCKLPGCQNETGFRTDWNLRRHQDTASYHKAQKSIGGPF